MFVLLLYAVVILFRSRILHCETGEKPSSLFDSVGEMTVDEHCEPASACAICLRVPG